MKGLIVMLSAKICVGIISNFHIGVDPHFKISHLQFTNEKIDFYRKKRLEE